MPYFEFRLPDIGEGISEAEIVTWHVAVGDRVEEDGRLADVMTDKATVEMESPVTGTIVQLAGQPGDQVAIGSMLVLIEIEDNGAPFVRPHGHKQIDPTSTAPAAKLVKGTGDDPDSPAATMLLEPALTDHLAAPSSIKERTNDFQRQALLTPARARPQLASPAVRQRARDLGIDLTLLKTEGDRIRHADLDNYLRYGAAQGYHDPGTTQARPDELVKVIGMRRRTAENMSAAKRTIPHFTYVDEIDVTALEAMRAALNAERGERPRLTVLPLLISAFCRAVSEFPMLNARYDDEAGVVTRSGRVHLGVATQTSVGLMVPVVRNAQDRNPWQLATEIARLAEAARAGKVTSAELTGSTLTVTSLGPLGGIATTPIINRPEVAILGPNRIVERPVFACGSESDKVRRAKLMNLSISCDHRVVDGWEAASFVQEVKRLLETPVLLFAAL